MVKDNKKKNNNGFTIIELLVVIAIIGLLSSIAIVSLNDTRLKARDAKRKADMSQVRLALQIYNDNNKTYPVCGSLDLGESDFGADSVNGSNCFNTVLTSYLTSGERPIMFDIPKDPLNMSNTVSENGTYIYRYVSSESGDQFVIVYETEDKNDNSPSLIRG